jgi:hypothetical protein
MPISVDDHRAPLTHTTSRSTPPRMDPSRSYSLIAVVLW